MELHTKVHNSLRKETRWTFALHFIQKHFHSLVNSLNIPMYYDLWALSSPVGLLLCVSDRRPVKAISLICGCKSNLITSDMGVLSNFCWISFSIKWLLHGFSDHRRDLFDLFGLHDHKWPQTWNIFCLKPLAIYLEDITFNNLQPKVDSSLVI